MSLISGVQGRCVRSSSNALFGWSLSLTRPSTYVPEIDLEDIISIEKTLESATSWHLIRKDKLKAWNHTRITPALLVCIAASSKVSTYLFFATSPLKGLSEQDYAKKALSPLLEIAFHGSSLITHWADTISEDNQKSTCLCEWTSEWSFNNSLNNDVKALYILWYMCGRLQRMYSNGNTIKTKPSL